MFDGFTVDEPCIYKGAARVVFADIGTAFPEELADVMDPTTFALTSAWHDWGATTCDGVTVTRGFDKDEGINVCQLNSPILKQGATNWRSRASFAALETCLADLNRAWEGSSDGIQNVDADEDYLDFGSPDVVTVRRVAFIQQHSLEDEIIRMIAFRRASLAGEDSEMAMNKTDPSGTPVVLEAEADTSVDVDQNLFRVFHYDNS
jgi:hypothetical protein